MANGIILSAGVRQNLLSLQATADLTATVQNRLATGKKVNSALDNPTNFFTAAALSARAGELTNLLDSMTNGINTLKAADNGLTSITTTIQSMQASVTSGSSSIWGLLTGESARETYSSAGRIVVQNARPQQWRVSFLQVGGANPVRPSGICTG